MKCFRFVAAEKANHPISLLCRVLGVSRSGFHAWERRPPSDRDLADAWLVERIREIHAESRETYGARRVHRALRHRGVRVGRKRVERLMRLRGLSGLVPRRYRRTTIRVPGVRVADDLVDRAFTPAGRISSGARTSSTCAAGRALLYLAAMMDCYSRRIVGWVVGAHEPRCVEAVQGLQVGLNRRSVHTDRARSGEARQWASAPVTSPHRAF